MKDSSSLLLFIPGEVPVNEKIDPDGTLAVFDETSHSFVRCNKALDGAGFVTTKAVQGTTLHCFISRGAEI
jgi:hypothetical protein